MIVKYKYEVDVEVDFVVTDTMESSNDVKKLIEEVLPGIYFYKDGSAFINHVTAKHIPPIGIMNLKKDA